MQKKRQFSKLILILAGKLMFGSNRKIKNNKMCAIDVGRVKAELDENKKKIR